MIGCCQKHAPRAIGDTRVMRNTWGGPLSKASGPDAPDPDWLLAAADKAAPAVRAAFLEALRRVRGSIKEADLIDAISRGDVGAALRALGLDRGLPDALKPGMMRPLEDAFINTGRATPERTLGVTFGMRFDLTNPNTATFLRNYDFNLIRQISDDTRTGIRTVISNAFAQGGHPYEQARIIRDGIGLTEGQADAVDNFRELLVSRDRQAMTRMLRDRRFDPTLDAALGANPDKDLSDEHIERMVSRYRERMLNMRATTIARTETIRASNAAQDMAWAQAADAGLLDRVTTRRYWLVTPDDRLCQYCERTEMLNAKGVPLGQPFDTPFGPMAFPPLHPNCRCVAYIGADRDGEN